MKHICIAAVLCSGLLFAGVCTGCNPLIPEQITQSKSEIPTETTAVPETDAETTEETTEETTASIQKQPEVEYAAADGAADTFYVTETISDSFMAVAYPQFRADMENADAINSVIRDFIEECILKHSITIINADGEALEKKFNGTWGLETEPEIPSNAFFTKKCDYKITRMDDRYISILLMETGEGSVGGFTEGLIIDLADIKAVMLSDLYRVDAEFAQYVRDTYNVQAPVYLTDTIGFPEEMVKDTDLKSSDSSLLEALQESDLSEINYSVHMASNVLVIHMPYNQMFVDHIEIRIPYEELEQFQK